MVAVRRANEEIEESDACNESGVSNVLSCLHQESTVSSVAAWVQRLARVDAAVRACVAPIVPRVCEVVRGRQERSW
jgi:hypothetical protein